MARDMDSPGIDAVRAYVDAAYRLLNEVEVITAEDTDQTEAAAKLLECCIHHIDEYFPNDQVPSSTALPAPKRRARKTAARSPDQVMKRMRRAVAKFEKRKK